MEITLHHYLVLSALLFSIGLYGAVAGRNAVGILLAIEIMLNSANLAFVAIAGYTGSGHIAGQLFAVFIITVAAAEAAVALALLLAIFRLRGTVDAEAINLMRW